MRFSDVVPCDECTTPDTCRESKDLWLTFDEDAFFDEICISCRYTFYVVTGDHEYADAMLEMLAGR